MPASTLPVPTRESATRKKARPVGRFTSRRGLLAVVAAAAAGETPPGAVHAAATAAVAELRN
jgi:hypothetical protein